MSFTPSSSGKGFPKLPKSASPNFCNTEACKRPSYGSSAKIMGTYDCNFIAKSPYKFSAKFYDIPKMKTYGPVLSQQSFYVQKAPKEKESAAVYDSFASQQTLLENKIAYHKAVRSINNGKHDYSIQSKKRAVLEERRKSITNLIKYGNSEVRLHERDT